MTIQTYALPKSMQFVARIIPSTNDPETHDAQILSELKKALSLIEQAARDKSTPFQTFSIAPLPQNEQVEASDTALDWTPPAEIDPRDDETGHFWARVARNPDLHQSAEDWLEMVLRLLERTKKSISHLWEYDEIQFAEPAVSILALVNPDFVPFYTRFLSVWDMEHEVEQHDVILQIFERHGITTQTENLIIVRTADGFGQRGEDTFEEVLPLLQDHYGDILDTDFFKRLVAYHHAHEVTGLARRQQKAFEDYKRKLLRNEKVQQPEFPRSLRPWFLEEQPLLAQRGLELFEELERKRLGDT